MTASRETLAVAALLALLGCGAPPPRDADSGPREVAPSPAPGEPAAREEADRAAQIDAMRQALEQALADPRHAEDLHLVVECGTDEGPRALEVYGNGVAIWNRGRQFELAADQVADLVELLLEEDFPAFDDVYGGKPKPGLQTPDKPSRGAAVRVICRVDLELAGQGKESAQLDRGVESAALKRLARGLLAACESAAERGVEIADLAAGLAKLSTGELAPETLYLMVHRKPSAGTIEPDDLGFLFRLQGPTAVTRSFSPAAGYGEPMELRLGRDELRDVATLLADHGAGDLPINLYAEHYTDLSLRILDHKRAIQARRFAGMTADTHGARQRDFEALFDAVLALHQRVLASGRPAADG